ncbi:MAG: S1 family peptidase [bacterium]
MKPPLLTHRLRRLTRHPAAVGVALLLASAALLTSFIPAGAPFEHSDSQLASLARESVVALGIEWTEGSTSRRRWYGTGFLLEDSGQGITAGHVIRQLLEVRNDLHRRDLSPAFVGALPEGTVIELHDLHLNPAILHRAKDAMQPAPQDLGSFGLLTDPPSAGLSLASTPPRTGQRLVAAGFPTGVTTITYPTRTEEPIMPTIKFGHVERLVRENSSPTRAVILIQHGLPLGSGFSGSPLINRHGKVVGVVTTSTHVHWQSDKSSEFQGPGRRFLHPTDINFAVPAGRLRDWLATPAAK